MATSDETVLVRQAFGMTMRALRERIGLAERSHMSGLECGKHTPTLETVLRFLPYLKVSFPKFADEFERQLRKARREDR